MDKFWTVWNTTGSKPRMIHNEKSDAVNEAVRLAEKHEGEFYIMECVGCAKKIERPVEYTEIEALPKASRFGRLRGKGELAGATAREAYQSDNEIYPNG